MRVWLSSWSRKYLTSWADFHSLPLLLQLEPVSTSLADRTVSLVTDKYVAIERESWRIKSSWDCCSLGITAVQLLCAHVCPGEREKLRNLALNRGMTTQIAAAVSLFCWWVITEKPYTWKVGDPEDDLALPHSFSVLLYFLLHIFKCCRYNSAQVATGWERCFFLTNSHLNV